jgi:uncharacterized protein
MLVGQGRSSQINQKGHSMSKQSVILPWKNTCVLRQEIRDRELGEADFAVDLNKVIFGVPGGTPPFYCDPVRFFAMSYATANLRDFSSAVLRRLVGKSGGESVINVSQTFGGGKSHTLAALYYLATLGKSLPRGDNTVETILSAAQLAEAPTARVAAVSFDKVDWKKGAAVKSPTGEVRTFRMPWNLIAWQMLGGRGLEILDRDEAQAGYDTPPADELWSQLLAEIETKDGAALILLDEFLMWAHDAASPDPTGLDPSRGPAWYERLKNFFQRLSQVVASSRRSCLVVSLLATEPSKVDEVGREILTQCNNGLGRVAQDRSPVEKDDLPELLRRRLFARYPQSEPDKQQHVLAFWPRFETMDPARARQPGARKKLVEAYPFHPDMLDRFFGKWIEVRGFQRTRGVLQTFANALREAEVWDESPLVSTQVLLPEPGRDMGSSLQKLANIAQGASGEPNADYSQALKTELPRVVDVQRVETPTLSGRELESACIAAFIYSQPLDQNEQANLAELRWLVAATCELPASLNLGLSAWAKTSWYLEECEKREAVTNVPLFWRLGPRPNLNQLHDGHRKEAIKSARSKFDDLAQNKCTPLYLDLPTDVIPHKIVASPGDVGDDGMFRLVVLGADFAGAASDPPHPDAQKFLRQKEPGTTRVYQNVVLLVTPSPAGLAHAEQMIAEWDGWVRLEQSPQFRELKPEDQDRVRKRKKPALDAALTAVKDAYQTVLAVESDGNVKAHKVTLGGESLMAAVLREKDKLRLFREIIDIEQIMPPNPLYAVWPAGAAYVPVADLYQTFARDPKLPKLLSQQTVLRSVADAVRRGLLALRCSRPDGSVCWFWKSEIDVAGWEKTGDAWLPSKAELTRLAGNALLPESLPGVWPKDGTGLRLKDLCVAFDGSHTFEEHYDETNVEHRPIPRAAFHVIHAAVADAVKDRQLWLVFGTDSVHGEAPAPIQLDPEAMLYPPPSPLAVADLLPPSLPNAWTNETEPRTTPASLYAALKAARDKPWPPRSFLEAVNAATGQGYFVRTEGTGPISSLQHEGDVPLTIRQGKPVIVVPTLIQPGRKSSNAVVLDVGEVQSLSDEISELVTALAGMDPQVEVRLSVKSQAAVDCSGANEILQRIKRDWKL